MTVRPSCWKSSSRKPWRRRSSCCAVSVQKSKLNFAEKLRTIFRECVLSVEAAQNLVVLKTIEGMAQGAAFTLDNMGDTDIVGTLAGDDTILLVFHDNVRALDFCEQVKQMLR